MLVVANLIYKLFNSILGQIGDLLDTLMDRIKKSLSGPALEFYRREFEFFDEITSISGTIRSDRYLSVYLFFGQETYIHNIL